MMVRDFITELIHHDMEKTVELHIKLNDSEYESTQYEIRKTLWSDNLLIFIEDPKMELIDSDELYDLREAKADLLYEVSQLKEQIQGLESEISDLKVENG